IIMYVALVVPVFFLLVRCPPRSTVFPTRRSSDLGVIRVGAFGRPAVLAYPLRSERGQGFGCTQQAIRCDEVRDAVQLIPGQNYFIEILDHLCGCHGSSLLFCLLMKCSVITMGSPPFSGSGRPG